MVSLSSIENKLDKIKKAIGNNGILKIYVWIKEDSPIRLDLIYKEEVKFVYCNSVKEYVELLKKYKTVENMRKQSVEELESVLPSKVARELKDILENMKEEKENK